MTQLASASGARLDCDFCGRHISATAATPEDLRQLSGFLITDGGADVCPRCANQLDDLVAEFPGLLR